MSHIIDIKPHAEDLINSAVWSSVMSVISEEKVTGNGNAGGSSPSLIILLTHWCTALPSALFRFSASVGFFFSSSQVSASDASFGDDTFMSEVVRFDVLGFLLLSL